LPNTQKLAVRKKKCTFVTKQINIFTVMHTYQIDADVSDKGVINLPSMPHLHNKKVKLIIIPAKDSTTEPELREHAMKRLLKRQNTMPFSHWSDDELDNMRYECLKEKH
jgi:hypothetical protein